MADPTFQIRGEPGRTHPEKRGGGGGQGGSQKKSFWPFSPQFGLKIRRGPTDNNNSNNNTTTTNNNDDDDLKEAQIFIRC